VEVGDASLTGLRHSTGRNGRRGNKVSRWPARHRPDHSA